MKLEQLQDGIKEKLQRKASADPKLHHVQLLVYSQRHNIHWRMAASKAEGKSAAVDQPFHTASIGKTFTGVIIAQLYEQGHLKLDDPISNYLRQDILDNLHVYQGKDFTGDIQIQHLFRNTSGLPDYFEDKPKQGPGFLQIVLDDPDRFWHPEETIRWTKENLQPKFAPGKGVHYTDTGYNLLGLIIESITSKPYHEVLHEYIFDPLQMKHSYLLHYSEPRERSKHPISPVYMGDLQVDVQQYRSFSSFYAGGQTVSTTDDLLIFMKALVNHELVRKETLHSMQQWNRMRIGLDYGSSLMRVKFAPFASKYVSWGHLGSTGSSMLYFPNLDTYIIGSFNQTAYISKGMQFVFFHVLRKLPKLGVTYSFSHDSRQDG